MGKKKHKKKQKKARLDEQPGTSSGSSSLHRIGQALLDQARSPAGRQLLATGLIVAASALARETTRRPSDGAAPSPEPASPETPPPQQEGGTAKPQQESGTTKSGISEVVTLAGMALSALDQFIHRPPSDNKG